MAEQVVARGLVDSNVIGRDRTEFGVGPYTPLAQVEVISSLCAQHHRPSPTPCQETLQPSAQVGTRVQLRFLADPIRQVPSGDDPHAVEHIHAYEVRLSALSVFLLITVTNLQSLASSQSSSRAHLPDASPTSTPLAQIVKPSFVLEFAPPHDIEIALRVNAAATHAAATRTILSSLAAWTDPISPKGKSLQRRAL